MTSPAVLSSNRGDWQTPDALIDLIENFNGDQIGFDPCSAAGNPVGADVHCYPPGDGLVEDWAGKGLVFVNPPFATMKDWARRCASYGVDGVEVILLAVPRTDTQWFRQLWTADALAFWHGSGIKGEALRGSRLQFTDPETDEIVKGNTSPSVLAYWGGRPGAFASAFQRYSRIVDPSSCSWKKE